MIQDGIKITHKVDPILGGRVPTLKIHGGEGRIAPET